MCLNYVEGGRCHLFGERCLLGERGANAKNSDEECEFHGKFDVWLTQQDDLLITDMGLPSEEPKRCLALGVRESIARTISVEESRKLATQILTSKRCCVQCGILYWISNHHRSSSLLETGLNSFCPDCINRLTDQERESRLGAQRYWCG